MLKKEEYLKTVKRPYAPLFASLILQGISDSKHYLPFIKEDYAVKDVIISEGVWYYSKKDMLLAGDLAFSNWIISKNLEKAEKEFDKRERALMKAVKVNFKDFCQAYEAYMPALILVWRAEEPVAREVKRLLEKKLSARETEELINRLNFPQKDNFYKKEEYELLNCADLIKHVKKYEWINSRYGEFNPYTVEEAEKGLSKINQEKFFNNYNERKRKLMQDIRQAKSILGKKDGHIIDFLQFIVYYRTQRTDIMNKAGYLYASRLIKIAEEKDLSYQQLLCCLKNEICGKLPAVNLIAERMADHAIVMENGSIRCASGQEKEKIKKIYSEKLTGIKKIQGNTASKGLVRGTVKIINGRDDYAKIKNGDILVASMTTPNMMPIMKKAFAFVTDEGGITCHAAIIAREMNKPCIIGTKIATKILRDGQVVVVDADKGVITIIK